MQNKIYANRRTNGIKITLTNSSNVQAEGHCKINSIETSRRVLIFAQRYNAAERINIFLIKIRRQLTNVIEKSDRFILNQHSDSSTPTTALNISFTISCLSYCPKSSIDYALHHVLNELEFSSSTCKSFNKKNSSHCF